MRNMQVSELCGAKAEFATSQALAMAHHVVPGVESLSKGIGRGRRRQELITAADGAVLNVIICLNRLSYNVQSWLALHLCSPKECYAQ